MSAAIDIIHGALFKLGVHSEMKPVSNEMLSYSFTQFQGFVKMIKDEGYDKTGLVVPFALADEVSERGGVRATIETLFAEHIAEYFKKKIDFSTKEAWNKLDRFYRTTEVPDLLPKRANILGAGNRRGRYR